MSINTFFQRLSTILTLCLLTVTTLQAAESDKDLADFLYYTSQLTIVADWATTRQCADTLGCYEANPLVAAVIGKDIDKTKLDVLSILTLYGNYALQNRLTTKQRIWFNGGHTVIRFVVVGHNVNMGLSLRF